MFAADCEAELEQTLQSTAPGARRSYSRPDFVRKKSRVADGRLDPVNSACAARCLAKPA